MPFSEKLMLCTAGHADFSNSADMLLPILTPVAHAERLRWMGAKQHANHYWYLTGCWPIQTNETRFTVLLRQGTPQTGQVTKNPRKTDVVETYA